jgi:ribonuclease R
VHIADVSHYVRPRSAVWEEAAERATSVYLPSFTIPMLPEALSNNLCSLVPRQDRLTLSVVMDLDRTGNVRDFQIRRSVINSSHRLTYAQALEAIEGRPVKLPADAVKLLRNGARLARLRRKVREDRGAIELDLPEVELEYDGDERIVGAHPLERDDAHRMIEEFMLAANECVARFCEDRGRRVLHRVHEPPDPEKISELLFFAKTLGLTSGEKDTRRALQHIIDVAEGTPLSHAVNLVVLKSMKHAEYLPESLGHYALATDHYCHFTSPIRRFPDLVVHTVLKEFDLEAQSRRPFDWSAHLDGYAQHASAQEVTAERAEREAVRVKLLRFLSDRVGESMHGVVVSVEEFGAFVELEEVPIDGLLPARTLGRRIEHDRRRHTLSDRSGRFRLRLGDRVKVVIDEIDLERRELDLRLTR